jgi:thiol:disulfide interchange protein DsbC
MTIRTLLSILLLALQPLAQADEAKIRPAIEAKLGGTKVDGVLATPVPGIFEVRFQSREGPQIIYTDAQGAYIFTGNLIDTRTDRNLTEERMTKLSAIDWSQLPLDLAIKVQRGNGKRAVAMFTDPYCPYCRRLEQTLLQIDDIAVYVFMYPVIRPEAADHSRAVWCSKDRAKAWLELAANERPKIPAASPNCPNPVDKTVELGRALRVNGTPTLFFPNGERSSSGMGVAELRAKLDETTKTRPK